jgi:hypothetical protein
MPLHAFTSTQVIRQGHGAGALLLLVGVWLELRDPSSPRSMFLDLQHTPWHFKCRSAGCSRSRVRLASGRSWSADRRLRRVRPTMRTLTPSTNADGRAGAGRPDRGAPRGLPGVGYGAAGPLMGAVVLRHDEHDLSGLDVPEYVREPEIVRLDDHGAPIRSRAAPP